jgi:hypothetical protein
LLMMFGCRRIMEAGGIGVSYEIREPEAMDTLIEFLARWNNYEAIR